MKAKIGLVEDEKHLRDILRGYLEKADYKVFAYEDAESAIEQMDEEMHLWILDIMLPGKNGFQLMECLKKKYPKVPIIFVSARDQEFDRILGLERGGEDYVTKPFSPKEMVLRVKRILDRCYQEEETVVVAEYTIDLRAHLVYDGTDLIDLSNREYLLLILLYKNIGRPFNRDEILNHVWNINYFGSDRVVDDLLRRLRKKMPRLPIQTIYGYGYRLQSTSSKEIEV